MVQMLKEGMRTKIAEAAEMQFAEVGFDEATVGAIASRAGVAAGTVYKYYPNKEQLFLSIVTDEFVEEFTRLTQQRIAAFARTGGMEAGQVLTEGAQGDLLRFYLSNRHKVVILLGGAKGTRYESFASEYIEWMVRQTKEQALRQFPTMKVGAVFDFMVDKILSDSVRGIVTLLRTVEDEKDTRDVFAAMMRYQLAGMNALVELLSRGRTDHARV